MALLCPICKKSIERSDDPDAATFFPFCSDRCRLIDLGRWLDGKYQVPVAEEDSDLLTGDEERDS